MRTAIRRLILPLAAVSVASSLCLPAHVSAEIRKLPGTTKPLPTEKYIHAVSEADSPVQQVYVKSKDGLYVAAAVRKPKGDGKFPAIIIYHGAPGGRGMEQLVGWSRCLRRERSPATPAAMKRCRTGNTSTWSAKTIRP